MASSLATDGYKDVHDMMKKEHQRAVAGMGRIPEQIGVQAVHEPILEP